MGGEAPVVAATGMSSVVTALTGEGGISATTFFTVIKDLMPLVVTLIPISLGLYFLRRLINGAGRAKVKF